LVRVALLELRAMEAIEAALELELAAYEVRGESEPLEIIAAQRGGLVRETEPFESLVPRAAVVARSGSFEVIRHRCSMYSYLGGGGDRLPGADSTREQPERLPRLVVMREGAS
jgi:hypothetical protein